MKGLKVSSLIGVSMWVWKPREKSKGEVFLEAERKVH